MNSLILLIVNLCFNYLQPRFNNLHLHRRNHYSSCSESRPQAGAAVNVSPMMAAKTLLVFYMIQNLNTNNPQTLMIVSQHDLEIAVKNVVDKLLEERENKPETYLTAEATAKKLGVDRSTLWRWNKEGYLLTIKIGSKVRYKLSDVERLQKGEVYG